MERARLKLIATYTSGLVLLLVGGYVMFLTAKLVQGVSVSAEMNSTEIRIRVLDAGCANVREVVNRIDAYSGPDLSPVIVETGRYESRDLEYSFLMSHVGEKARVKRLARLLQIDPTAVIERPLPHDVKYITATLVAGRDMDQLLSLKTKHEEKPKEN